MGLFGRKKNKTKAPASEPSYDPPADDIAPVTSEASSPDDDVVKVASVGIASENGDFEETPEIVENKSIVSKASSYVSSVVLSLKNSTIGAEEDETPYNEHEDGEDGMEKKKSVKDQLMERVTATYAAILLFWFGLSKVTKVAVLAGAAVGAVAIAAIGAFGGHTHMFPAHINVAFIGNSYFYVNDLPRVVEQIAGGHITQDSVIHNAASILQIIMTGNGMWHKWATKKAMIGGVKFETYRNTTEYLYDMGACSVPQLLTGHDQLVTVGNRLGSFIDDGNNPCFQQDAYREYQESTDLKRSWDFVVITDQSKTMAFEDTRQDALAAFNYTYGPILKKHRISPVIVQPHAYSSSGANASGLDDLATFTALIMEGAQVYRKYINRRSGWFTKAHIAPVGNAFLAIYEESPYDIWPKLFLDDGIHPSAYGTFVYGCVIYATMTGHMPKYKRVVVDDMENSAIFSTARRLQASSSQAGYPTKEEAKILYNIAKKVAVKGYKPQVLRGFKLQEGDSEFLRSSSSYDNVYNGDYNGGQQYANGNNFYSQMYDNQANDNGYYNNNGNNNGDNNGDDNGDNNGDNNGNNYAGDYGGNNDYYQDNDAENNYDNQDNYYQVNNGYDNYQNYNSGGNGDNYQNYNNGGNGDNYQNYNNGGNGNDDNGGNYNYQVNNGYDNYQQYENGDNADGNGDDNANVEYQEYGNDGNGNAYNEAADQYYVNYAQNNGGNRNNNNNGNQQYQYGGGNQNMNQFYYADLTDDNSQ